MLPQALIALPSVSAFPLTKAMHRTSNSAAQAGPSGEAKRGPIISSRRSFADPRHLSYPPAQGGMRGIAPHGAHLRVRAHSGLPVRTPLQL
mmetsp:Transcript_44/g.122  ORF Transcript_44/g.122 Transcript_44/m.122 type:complete len:91 (+) Transcript_44:490-762(+)